MLRFPKINLSIQLIIAFAIALIFGAYFPPLLKSFFLALSLSIKELLVSVLPIIIFSCLFYSMVANQGRALGFLIILLVMVCASNFVSLFAAYDLGKMILPSLHLHLEQTVDSVSTLMPLWDFAIPSLISNQLWVLVLGFGSGLLFSFLPYQLPLKLSERANHLVIKFLRKCFVPVLPLFSFGFILKMQHEGILGNVLIQYAPIILLVFLGNLVYIALMFLIAARFNLRIWVQYLKSVIPVGILGFTTMSSLATMPVTLAVAEKNTNDIPLSRAIIPATANIHMIGDSITTPLVFMATMLTFGIPLPTALQYYFFVLSYMLAKFAVPGVPCGNVIVLIPILQSLFGFTSDMSAFIMAIYIIFDPFLTAGNVLGNSAFVIILSRIMKRFLPSREAEAPAT